MTSKEIGTLRDVLSFLMNDAYRDEKKKKGWYETRGKIEFDDKGRRHIIGSGVCNTLAGQIQEMLNRRENK